MKRRERERSPVEKVPDATTRQRWEKEENGLQEKRESRCSDASLNGKRQKRH